MPPKNALSGTKAAVGAKEGLEGGKESTVAAEAVTERQVLQLRREGDFCNRVEWEINYCVFVIGARAC